ncbi:DMT family transporter [Engelhardtia mirabilis]|uniref:Putative inner membrane transporter yiJE n=1 Tax=Engelhardtia mirabilis TaxID=2528011 RepID=A0A518BEN2_9BACT|nr:putative inner membrane transporter yiJE [Planctomycetes bacterium Pla133]QDU99767.1 putative inner membrane transporter yiJE [Planctomycetes bacterium Pla86]
MPKPRPTTTILLTVLTLVAFAGNSLLCRAALRGGAMDPLAFTGLRLASGALVLLPLAFVGDRERPRAPWPFGASVALLVYATAFSLAYVGLDAGIGALLLFGSVQITMIGAGLDAGERLGAAQAVGILAAIGGLAWLLAPGASAPAPVSAALMVVAGVAWGGYSLLGRGVASPVRATARNFVLAGVPGVGLFALGSGRIDGEGLVLACLSGALTSGVGYVIWYAALRGLTRTRAAVVQLAVPVVAAAGGVVLLGEATTPRLLAAGVLTLGGVAAVILAPPKTEATR